MQVKFHGAASEVTGSCHEVIVGGESVLLDCGLIQGRPQDEARNRTKFKFAIGGLKAVVLSHAHIDHSGRLPLLVKAGYSGRIYAHRATVDLCRIMLRDAAYLEERETAWQNKKRRRKGLSELMPLYSLDDVEKTMQRFEPIEYGQQVQVAHGINVTLRDAGHILGSAIVELNLQERGIKKKLVYSGDLGPRGLPLLCDHAVVPDADVVLLESTYGARCHRSWEATIDELKAIFSSASVARGNILIPAFAVGRTQELIYLFARYHQDWGIHRWQIFLDSPLAIEATALYDRHRDLLDEQAQQFVCDRKLHENLPNLRLSSTAEESMGLNSVRNGAIIIAGSGMCTGGRIRQHLKHHLWRDGCHVVIVGYQAQGTLGRALVDGATHVRLWGEMVRVAAKVSTVGGLSAHADQQGLLEWFGACEKRPPVYLVHGEPKAQNVLAERLRAEFGVQVMIPSRGEAIDLITH